ncbi:MAG: cobalamin-dependent protein, partial [Spirochaetia bacterium]|nr:cobalamin-dependent protein [Spirochaetia bacterium]
MKIMISYPPLKGDGTPTLGQNRQFQWFHNASFIYPMVPAAAATYLQSKGHNVMWDDSIASMRSFEQWEHILSDFKPDLIAMETKTPVVKQHWAITARIKELSPQTKVVMMGDHVTAMPDETMQNSQADFVITGGDYDFLLDSVCTYLTDKKAP